MSDDEFTRMLAEVSAEFRSELPARLAMIDQLWACVAAGRHDAAQMDELIRAAHKIAGSAGTFGMASLGDAAASLEAALDPYRGTAAEPDETVRQSVASLINELRRGCDDRQG